MEATWWLVGSWRNTHAFRVSPERAWCQGFSASQAPFRVTLNCSTGGVHAELEGYRQKADALQMGYVLSLESRSKQGVQYREQDFGGIQEWGGLALLVTHSSAAADTGLPRQTVPFFQQALSTCLCSPSPAFTLPLTQRCCSSIAPGFHWTYPLESRMGLAVHGVPVWLARDLAFKYSSYVGEVSYFPMSISVSQM